MLLASNQYPPLAATIERLYSVFAAYEVGDDLLVCECPSCVGPESKAALISTPVPQISRELLAEYTHSAHGRSPDRELKHFLPRYFELILQNEPPSHWGLEEVLDRLRLSDWRRCWPAHEVLVLDVALDAIVAAALTEGEPLAAEPMASVLALIFHAEGDPLRLGAVWARVDTEFATRRLAQAVIDGRRWAHEGPVGVGEAWASFLAWAASPQPSQRLEAALMAADPEDEKLYIDAIKAA